MYQNYPNPFNPTTTIEFDLPEDAVVTVIVYNLLGQEVTRLIDGELMEAGEQQIDFDGAAFPAGVYFYRLTATSTVAVMDDEQVRQKDEDEANGSAPIVWRAPQKFTRTMKMILLK